MRLRKKKWASPLIKEYTGVFVLENAMLEKEIKINQINALEIGAGKGGFIVGMAKKHKNVNFYGIEQNQSAFALCLKKLINEEEQLSNVKIIRSDVNDVIELIKDESIDTIYLNFSDPWPKSRHHKRRLTYPLMLDKYKRILKKEGKIFFKTDNELLFNDSIEYFKEKEWHFINVDYDYQLDKDDVMTEYEEKFRSMGNKIYRLIVSKER
ncbi:TPA: tRNA (guanosine(46)-N7)-methyltransferase TrmB [bacterium]|jgi:tRNA (guanine-N7-)-methyltransferase|nr:tRNA (guanosine(46)-N7)-methyltransferase TrmB [bacterium]